MPHKKKEAEYAGDNIKQRAGYRARGERFGAEVPDGAVVAMYGELGSGKTAFVRGMAGAWA